MRVLRTREEVTGLGAGVLVPTMGALHAGHEALIALGARVARERGLPGGCVAYVFVNPKQFNESADYERYPRDLERDASIAERAGASAVFAPSYEEVYPDERSFLPELPAVATEPGLEDAFRPGHFEGVCEVLNRMFRMLEPAAAVFGEKDWQQLKVAEALVRQEGLATEIIGGRTVREADGLALSSRNVHLSEKERERGLSLSRALIAASHETTPERATAAMREVFGVAGVEPDYAVVRDAETVVPAEAPERVERWRAVVAARVGFVRLLDNASWPDPGEDLRRLEISGRIA